MAEKDELSAVGEEQALDIERIKRRLDMLDHRLDSIDSMVTVTAWSLLIICMKLYLIWLFQMCLNSLLYHLNTKS